MRAPSWTQEFEAEAKDVPADSMVTETLTIAFRIEVDVRDHESCRGNGRTRRTPPAISYFAYVRLERR